MSKTIAALKQMHNIERFATEIYRVQRRAFKDKISINKMTAAMHNEQEHIDDLLECIISQGETKSWMGTAFEVMGKFLGFLSTLLGRQFVFWADAKIEQRAIKDYGIFLKTINFDAKSKRIVVKNLNDEKVHLRSWQDALGRLTGKPPKDTRYMT
ncbi:MAG: ferritin-like domain-containing protein [Chloroflexi bacterium]|mgnify:CR=1 FL=1|nr:ferritin-like domain-containing protein [Chloroflexota bacterium]MBT7080658.1 ferritin-like domain-containing protein [Chloroflexota bacterium]MBT7289935.1 ferritin-like domain-containing protein [Chloroflexota bacterium]